MEKRGILKILGIFGPRPLVQRTIIAFHAAGSQSIRPKPPLEFQEQMVKLVPSAFASNAHQ